MNPLAESVPTVSVVIPVFNEAENIETLLRRVRAALESSTGAYELVIVDDGSRDASPVLIQRAAGTDTRIRLVQLSRNFGHQAALLAGMDNARGDAVITMDADLQHPPELLPELIRLWREGAEVVQTIRREPADDSALKRMSSRWFYRLLSSLSRYRVTPGAADFRLLSRPAAEAFRACRERCRFNRGLVQWIGFRYVELVYDAAPRHAGRSKYSWRAMLRLAGDAVFSFSTWPLRLAGLAGACVSLAAAAYLLFVLWARIFTDRVEPGWSSILASVLVIGGMQLVVLWILGEYVGRLYEEAKQRPLYIVRPGATRGEDVHAGCAAPPLTAERQPAAQSASVELHQE
ncbi:MAG: glycosyltransferase family 2 protein [Phycisphaerae bacterium]|jgi:dolichol-phosphate mannosyltransferase